MKTSALFILPLFCSLTFAQGNFSGPGVLSHGLGEIGKRSGQDVDLKYYVNANGVWDSGLTPYGVTSDGKLVEVGALYGIELGVGGYGRHTFRRSSIGVDYSGNFRHYSSASLYDGNNQQLGLNYTYQKSRRLLFDFSGTAGTQTFGTAFSSIAGGDSIVNNTSLLFDNRVSYYQPSMTTRYALTNRTTVSMGGNYYSVHRKSTGLLGVNGYTLQGALTHELSRVTTIGATYQHTHFDFPRSFGESDINSYNGSYSRLLGRTWTFSLSAGVFVSDVQGVQSTALDPAIAALLGVSNVRTIFYKRNILPSGAVVLSKKFRRALISGNYTSAVNPGNGVYLTSRQTSYGGAYSYTGLRRWSLSVNANSSKLASLGQNLVPYTQIAGGADLSYHVGKNLNLSARYSRRHQDLNVASFQPESSRISIGIYFSPGEIPVSFH